MKRTKLAGMALLLHCLVLSGLHLGRSLLMINAKFSHARGARAVAVKKLPDGPTRRVPFSIAVGETFTPSGDEGFLLKN